MSYFRITFLFLLLLQPFASQAKELTIFFIHGLNSSYTVFCDMPQMLEDHYRAQGHTLRVRLLVYDTKNDQKSVNQFVREIRDDIVAYYKTHVDLDGNPIKWNSPYSFIVHSQGGIVSSKYLYQHLNRCYKKRSNDGDKMSPNESCSVPPNMQDLITLGTPFWGSQGANRSDAELIGPLVREFSGTYEQLIGLRVGSNMITSTRRAFLKNSLLNAEGGWTHFFNGPSPVRIHNLVGEITSYLSYDSNWLTEFLLSAVLGNGAQEYDVIVSPSGGRVDFNYMVQEHRGDSFIKGKTQMGHSYYTVPMAHVPLQYKEEGLPRIVTNWFPEIDATMSMACKRRQTPYSPKLPDGFDDAEEVLSFLESGEEIKTTAQITDGDGQARFQARKKEFADWKLYKQRQLFEENHLGYQFVLNVLDNYFQDTPQKRVALPDYPAPVLKEKSMALLETPQERDLREQELSAARKLYNFLVDMQLVFPSSFKRPEKQGDYMRVENVTVIKDEPEKIYQSILESGEIFRGVGINDDTSDRGISTTVAFHHDGRFDRNYRSWDPLSDEPPPESTLSYKIRYIPGVKNTEINNVPVTVSYSTYVRAFLETYEPMKTGPQDSFYIGDSFDGKVRLVLDSGPLRLRHDIKLSPDDYLVAAKKYPSHLRLFVLKKKVGGAPKMIRYWVSRARLEESSLKNTIDKLRDNQGKFPCYVGLTSESDASLREKASDISNRWTLFYENFNESFSIGRIPYRTKVKVLGRYSYSLGRSQASLLARKVRDRYLIELPRRGIARRTREKDIRRMGSPIHLPEQYMKDTLNTGYIYHNSIQAHETLESQLDRERLIWVDAKDVGIIDGLSCDEEF